MGDHWFSLPPLAEQYAQLQGFIVEELPEMRREAVHLVRQAVSEDRRAYVPHPQSL